MRDEDLEFLLEADRIGGQPKLTYHWSTLLMSIVLGVLLVGIFFVWPLVGWLKG